MLVSDKAKWFAIGEMLADWKEGLTADQVLSEIELNTDDVTYWEPFEHYDGDQMYEWVMNLAEHAQKLMDGE